MSTLTDVFEFINYEVAKMSTATIPLIREVLVEAERELTEALANWTVLGKGDARFTPQVYRNALVQIRGTLSSIQGNLKTEVNSALQYGGVLGAKLATRHLINQVQHFSGMFEGTIRPIALNASTVLAEGKGLVFKKFANSAKRYAGQVGEDIRKQLAIGVVRGENIDQLTTRLARLGGPKGWVYTAGSAASPRAKAEFISEGLFRRYTHFAERLAVTETVNAYNSFAMEGIKELNDEDPGYLKRWNAAIDGRTCGACREYDGQTVKLNQSFKGGVKQPTLHPRCRCALCTWRKEWG